MPDQDGNAVKEKGRGSKLLVEFIKKAEEQGENKQKREEMILKDSSESKSQNISPVIVAINTIKGLIKKLEGGLKELIRESRNTPEERHKLILGFLEDYNRQNKIINDARPRMPKAGQVQLANREKVENIGASPLSEEIKGLEKKLADYLIRSSGSRLQTNQGWGEILERVSRFSKIYQKECNHPGVKFYQVTTANNFTKKELETIDENKELKDHVTPAFKGAKKGRESDKITPKIESPRCEEPPRVLRSYREASSRKPGVIARITKKFKRK